MKILIIGLDDKKQIVEQMMKTKKENLEFFYTENISAALGYIDYYDIDMFIVEADKHFSQLKEFIDDISYHMNDYVRGIFVSNSNHFESLVLAMNVGFIDGYIVRPYSKKDFCEMWERYYKNRKH